MAAAAAGAGAGFGGAGGAVAGWSGAGFGGAAESAGFADWGPEEAVLEASGGVLGVEEPPESVPAPAGGDGESDAPPPAGRSGAASGFLGRAGALPSSGAVWAPSSELIAGFLPAQFGRILNVYHTAQPRCAAGPRPAQEPQAGRAAAASLQDSPAALYPPPIALCGSQAAHAAPCLRPQPCAVHARAASRPARPRSPSAGSQAAHAAPCLRPQPCAVHARAASRPARPRGPPPSGAQSGMACRSPIPPHCTSRRHSRAPPLAAHGQRATRGHVRHARVRMATRAANRARPGSARMQAMRSPPRRCGPWSRGGSPKRRPPPPACLRRSVRLPGTCRCRGWRRPVGAGQIRRSRMRASAGAPCILGRAVRQAGRTPRCPPGGVSGQAQAWVGGRTCPHPIPHRILRAACPAGGLGRVGGIVPSCQLQNARRIYGHVIVPLYFRMGK